ncbi:hypothetical protein PNH50_12385 [Leisingera aquaemixtae]|uniref:hypothetical protein n=1 Tax=Leisingera aquaemixtae TaxID=1396826 RepID=UPI0039841E5D
MEAFTAGFFFDYLNVTMTNEIDGSGEKPGLSAAPADQEGYNTLARGPVLRCEHEAAEGHEEKAREALLRFVVSTGLYKRAEGEGRHGYRVGFQFGAHPTQGKPFVTVRGGHKRNMPTMEISGGNGGCARIAPLVREYLGPQLVSRADVSIDIKKEGLFERLHKHMIALSLRERVHPPQVEGDDETGKTLYWLHYLGKSRDGRKDRYRKRGVWLRVYQKDMERVARGQISSADADPNLVRLEFVFIHDEREGKARLGMMTPQEMLAGHRRSREFVQWLARECEGLSEEEAVLGLTKINMPADDRTAEERAISGIAQYKTLFVDASIERIVNRKFDGDWSSATVSASDVYMEVERLVLSEILAHGTIEKRIEWHCLNKLRSDAEKAERLRDQMGAYLSRQKAAQDAAFRKMADAYAVAVDGDKRNLNHLRAEIVWEHAVMSAKHGASSLLLRVLDRSYESAIKQFMENAAAA